MRYFIIFLTVLNLWGNFSIVEGFRPKSAIDNLHFHNIRDFYTIPQNIDFYARQITPFSWSEQINYAREYIKSFFSPWQKKSFNEPVNNLKWQIKMVERREIYGFNKRVIKKSVTKWWVKNSNFAKLDTLRAYAISIKQSNLKAFPTTKDIYLNPNISTRYYPFDYNQNSELHINVPLYVSHFSLDKKWAFVHAGYAFGWVKLSDIAFVDKKFIKNFKSGRYFISIKDNLFIKKDNRFYSLVKLGTLFPYRNGKILIATKDAKNRAKIAYINKPSSNLIASFPIRFNRKNVAYVAGQFVGEPYGWGGKAYCRDCSATTRDFFAPFGIYLKRNSYEQAREGKWVVNIKGLNKNVKKAVIIKYAKPFRSLLYVPGHITIYIGRYKNEPIVMHTYWGVRLNDWSKYTLSRTIISTTEPGKELPNIREKSKLINSLQKIINF